MNSCSFHVGSMFVHFSFPFPTPQSTKSTQPLLKDPSFPEASVEGAWDWGVIDGSSHTVGTHTGLKIWEFTWKFIFLVSPEKSKELAAPFPFLQMAILSCRWVLAVFFRLGICTVIHLRPHRSLLSPQTSLFQSYIILSWSLKSCKFALNFNLYLS